MNNSGLGFYPHFVRQREEQERRGHVKRVAFMLALHAVVRRYFRPRINVHLDEAEALEHVTPLLVRRQRPLSNERPGRWHAAQAGFRSALGVYSAAKSPRQCSARGVADAHQRRHRPGTGCLRDRRNMGAARHASGQCVHRWRDQLDGRPALLQDSPAPLRVVVLTPPVRPEH